MKSTEGKLMTADELREYLGVSKCTAYALLHREDFPSISIAGRLYAIRDQVDIWTRSQVKQGGYSYE